MPHSIDSDGLQSSDSRWRYALEGAGDGVWDWNMTHGRIFYSPRWKQMLGYEGDEIGSGLEEWSGRIHPADHDDARRALRRHLEGDIPEYVSEHRMRCKDGSYKWILDRGKVIERSADGRALRMVGTHADISAQRAAIEALKESDDRFRALVEDLSVGVVLQDRQDRVLVANRAAREILGQGLAGGQVTSSDPRWQLTNENGGELRAEDTPSVQAARSLRAVHSRILSARRLDTGERRWLQVSAVPRLQAGGDLLWILVTIVDITAQREAEEERFRIEEQMRNSQKLESLVVLAGGVAHDFNNLLTAMLGHAGLARDAVAEGTDPQQALAAIERSALRAAELAHQMLAFSGRATVSRTACDLAEVARDMSELLRTAISRKAELKFALAPAVVAGDATQLRQVMMNLLKNASDALDDGPGTIFVRTGVRVFTTDELRSLPTATGLSEGRYAVLDVEDDGAGIEAAVRRRIFDPFFSTKFAGRGLGLAVVLGIARSHQGSVLVDSAPGRGTRFQVLIPAQESGRDMSPAEPFAEPRYAAPPDASASAHDLARQTAASHGDRPGRSAGGPSANVVVLVIDDEPDVRDLMRRVLERAGYGVLTAADGAEGVETFHRHRDRISLVVADLTMPKLNGRQAADRIRALNPTVPVLLTTGYSDAETVAAHTDTKTRPGFLPKPFRGAELVQAVARLLAAADAPTS